MGIKSEHEIFLCLQRPLYDAGLQGKDCKVSLKQLVAEPKIPMIKTSETSHGPLYDAGLQGKLNKNEGGICAPQKSLFGLQETVWLRK